MFDKLLEFILQFIGLFKFWRVIPFNKEAVRTRWGKNPIVLKAGLHFIYPFEIDHTETCTITSDWVATLAIHITTTDFKTATVAPVLKFSIVDSIAWFYKTKNGENNLHDIIRLCTSDVLTDCTWAECMKKPVWTAIKTKIKNKSEDLGVKIEDYGLIDLAISRIIITQV